MIWRAKDRHAAHAATAQLLTVIKHGNDLALRWRVRLNQFDVERGETRRADHDDVLDGGMDRLLLLIVLAPQRQDGARGQHAGGKNENLYDGYRAGNAVEAGEDEKYPGGGQAGGNGGADDTDGVMNGEIAR